MVHPAKTVPSGTLVNALAFHFQHRGHGQLSSVGTDKARPGIVHRLDRNTTGAMVVAKTEGAHWSLYEQFAVRSVWVWVGGWVGGCACVRACVRVCMCMGIHVDMSMCVYPQVRSC